MSAKATFGNLKEQLYQGDYIKRKKAILTYCHSPSNCNKLVSSPNYETINTFNLGFRLQTRNILRDNKKNLIIGQYSKSNLDGVCTVIATNPCINIGSCPPCEPNLPLLDKDPCPINPNSDTPFYLDHTIDPLGELFGNSQCGELNYTYYMTRDESLF
jgi:hypothetical protein